MIIVVAAVGVAAVALSPFNVRFAWNPPLFLSFFFPSFVNDKAIPSKIGVVHWIELET